MRQTDAIVTIAEAVRFLGIDPYLARVTLPISVEGVRAILAAGGTGSTTLYRQPSGDRAIDSAQIVCDGVTIACNAPERDATAGESRVLGERANRPATPDEYTWARVES